MSDRIERAYALALEQYAEFSVDVASALRRLAEYQISIHCWQADDVAGFERPNSSLSGGGIQATGNYPGKARGIVEARQDYEKVFSLLPGTHRLNLHACYGDFSQFVERDALEISHYKSWIDWAKAQGIGIDFNSTCFSHPKSESGYTLSSKDAGIRDFWIEHVRRCRAISADFGRALGSTCIHNVWIPDGAKDVTVDRLGHRTLLAQSLDACFEKEYDDSLMRDAVESKLFGIGSEWFVVGSHEFYLGYALSRNKVVCFDMGHYHPTESVADKISSTLQFTDELLLHMSRPVRWDSDHVVILNDATRDVAQEIVRCGGEGKTIYLALDFFDASINRIGAYVIGVRAALQTLLQALLLPEAKLLAAEENGEGFKKLALLEQAKALPFGAVWDHYCLSQETPPGAAWIPEVERYERDVLVARS